MQRRRAWLATRTRALAVAGVLTLSGPACTSSADVACAEPPLVTVTGDPFIREHGHPAVAARWPNAGAVGRPGRRGTRCVAGRKKGCLRSRRGSVERRARLPEEQGRHSVGGHRGRVGGFGWH